MSYTEGKAIRVEDVDIQLDKSTGTFTRCSKIIPLDELLRWCRAARRMWDTSCTIADAESGNPEYLRAQVEMISEALEWPISADLDSEDIRTLILLLMFVDD